MSLILGRGARQRWRVATLSMSLLAMTACGSSDEPQAGPPDDYVCDISPGSTEEKLLLHVLRADSFTTRHGSPTHMFVERVQDRLRENAKDGSSYSVRQCEYFPNGKYGGGQATIEYDWSPLTAPEGGKDAEGTRHYELNGVAGESNDVMTDLYVRCDMPGALGTPSRKVLLHADASFTVNLGEVHDHGTQDQQMDFVYRMTRRATEVLGCENKPLEKDPVVKPVAGTGTS
ncbi:hypothetical protein ABZV60_26730 [Streptomyces sp. NPDC004787]|uniref:hypothetical protein n=1 Tax=Streptomyces sp. NPDC004787 TaxID=3154291 RepID=UPI0033A2C277